MDILKLIIFLVFICFLLVFGTINQSSVAINFFGWTTPPVSFVIIFFGAVLIGSVITGIIALLNSSKLKGIIQKKERKNKELEQKIIRLELKIRELDEKLEEKSETQ